ncbi:hypothetical protein TR51_02820 [Kitasatospora griseola]|uniref:Uncharacterized protein n=1 Tax=Kitasatospora griseola TaxID=2064 RepID=A0A0D0P4E3_KITGR|nr:hypothetical protein [Kitasatospora griseola]KIQ66521.1 hypothetical protein TR51_02820 [Kitasatospora griseola]GGQ67697.1 hypothetical protein GCM10010195_24180 [Kitasatospora griseola]
MAAARSGRNDPKKRRSDDGTSPESLIDEFRDRRIFRIGDGAAEPDQGPEGASGTAQSEKPENGGPES